jgi:hypothetical protein
MKTRSAVAESLCVQIDGRTDRRMAGESVFNRRSAGYRMLLKAENFLTGVYITFKSYVFVLPFQRYVATLSLSVALVRKRTIPTERPPLVGEVSAKLSRVQSVAWSGQRIPMAVILGFLDRSRYFFIQVAPQLSSRGWVDPVPDPLLLRKSGRVGNRTRDLWICSQKLWPLDYRGGDVATRLLNLHQSSSIYYFNNTYLYV